MMREIHRLRPLQVRVAGDQHLAVRLAQLNHRVLQVV